MEELIRLLTLQDANTRVVLIGTTMLGIAAGVIGCFAVLRKRALMGDAVAHAALPGVCLAYFLVGDRHFGALMLGALVAGVIAAGFVSLVKQHTRVKEDAAIAIAIGGFFGVGIVLSRIIQNQPTGNRAGLDGFIFGKAASMVSDDARLIVIVSVCVIGVAMALFKEFKLLCFDREYAAGLGWPTLRLDLVLMVLVCACTVAGLPAVGVVLMVALLVIPAVAARFWTSRLMWMLALSGVFGGVAGAAGTVISATVPSPAGALSRGWPTGPMIVLVASAIFCVSLLGAPERGLIADLLRRRRVRARIAMQNMLRDAYEHLESRGAYSAPWSARIGRAGEVSRATLSRAAREGLVTRDGNQWFLTQHGQDAAARVVRAHRLWELFLIEQADIAVDHVDRDADEIEHVLPAEVIQKLEARLTETGRLPRLARRGAKEIELVPESPHPIEPNSSGDAQSRSQSGRAGGVKALMWAGSIMAFGAGVLAVEQRALGAEADVTVAPPAISHTLFHLGTYGVSTNDVWTAATGAVCCVACAIVGCFLVLRRMSLLGDAISHAILPGLAIAFMLTHTREPAGMLAGALVVGVLTAVLSTGLSRWGRVPEDASMGVVFTSLFALGVILITLVARDVDLDPGCVLYGLIEFVPFETVRVFGADMPRAFVWLAIVLMVNGALIATFFKELRIVCFDPQLASTMGLSAAVVHYGLMTCVAGTAVASFEAVGSILVVAMLVAPGATAHLLTDRLSSMIWLSAAIGCVSALAGYAMGVWLNTSVAGMIASVSLAIFALAAIASPRYGVLARWIRRPAAGLPNQPMA